MLSSVCTSKITRGPNWSLLTFVTRPSQLLAFGWGKPNLRIWTSEGFHTCQVLKNDYIEHKLFFLRKTGLTTCAFWDLKHLSHVIKQIMFKN